MIKTYFYLNINIYLIVTMLTRYIHYDVILVPHGSMKIEEIYLKNRELIHMRCDERIIIKKYDKYIYIETEDKIRTINKERYFTEQILDILKEQIFF